VKSRVARNRANTPFAAELRVSFFTLHLRIPANGFFTFHQRVTMMEDMERAMEILDSIVS
jgi:hypothetical protein